jgi:hypothetical protein
LTGTATDPDSGNITNVQFSIDTTNWSNATATDRAFNSPTEDYYFDVAGDEYTGSTLILEPGDYTIYIRALDSEGAITGSADFATCEISIAALPESSSLPTLSSSSTAQASAQILPETGRDRFSIKYLFFLFTEEIGL